MEIIQDSFNREDYFSVKECAEYLDVTPKTIRNRIESKRIHAYWRELGKGKSQWLILKSDVQPDQDEESNKPVRSFSSSSALVEEIKAQFKAENEFLRQELQEIKQAQQRLEKMLIEKDENIIRLIQEKNEPAKSWWKFW